MDPETSEVENHEVLLVKENTASSVVETIKKIHKADFLFGDEAIFSAIVTAVVGCPEDINNRVKYSKVPLLYTVKVKSEKGKDIMIWSSVHFNGFKDKESYEKGKSTYESIREYFFDIRDAVNLYDGRHDLSAFSNCSILLIEEKAYNRFDIVEIPREPAQAGHTQFVNQKVNQIRKAKLRKDIMYCALMFVVIVLLFMLGYQLE